MESRAEEGFRDWAVIDPSSIRLAAYSSNLQKQLMNMKNLREMHPEFFFDSSEWDSVFKSVEELHRNLKAACRVEIQKVNRSLLSKLVTE